jgi:hypothetical protein
LAGLTLFLLPRIVLIVLILILLIAILIIRHGAFLLEGEQTQHLSAAIVPPFSVAF